MVRKITGPKREKKQEAGENCVKRGSIMCVPYEILGDKSKEAEIARGCGRCERERKNRSYRIDFSGET
jgi:hypothetical protein